MFLQIRRNPVRGEPGRAGVGEAPVEPVDPLDEAVLDQRVDAAAVDALEFAIPLDHGKPVADMPQPRATRDGDEEV